MALPPPTERLNLIDRLYPETGAHAKDHARETALSSWNISYEPEYANYLTDRHRELIFIAAILHDSGYGENQPYWSGMQWEHPYGSDAVLKRNIEHLSDLTPEEKIYVRLLVLNHDHTNFRFPGLKRLEIERLGTSSPLFAAPPGPAPGIISGPPEIPNEFYDQADRNYPFWQMLSILREADSRLGSPERTINFTQSRGIPTLADDGGIPGVGILAWQESGAANVLLAAKRALLDAYTKQGQIYAWNMYQEALEFVKKIFIENKPEMANVNNLVSLRFEDVQKYIWQATYADRDSPRVQIIQAIPLENIPIFLPFEFSHLSYVSRIVDIDRISIPNYGMRLNLPKINVEYLQFIRDWIIRSYTIDILTELSGICRVLSDFIISHDRFTKEATLIPPILRQNGSLAYGEEWLSLAKLVGVPKIRALIIK